MNFITSRLNVCFFTQNTQKCKNLDIKNFSFTYKRNKIFPFKNQIFFLVLCQKYHIRNFFIQISWYLSWQSWFKSANIFSPIRLFLPSDSLRHIQITDSIRSWEKFFRLKFNMKSQRLILDCMAVSTKILEKHIAMGF